MLEADIKKQEEELSRFADLLLDSGASDLPVRSIKVVNFSGVPELRFIVKWPLRGYPMPELYYIQVVDGEISRVMGKHHIPLGKTPEEALNHSQSVFLNPFEKIEVLDKWQDSVVFGVVERPEDGSYQGISTAFYGKFHPSLGDARAEVENFLREKLGPKRGQ